MSQEEETTFLFSVDFPNLNTFFFLILKKDGKKIQVRKQLLECYENDPI